MSRRPPLNPEEGWLRDGRQQLEITTGEWLPGEPVPLLKSRRELSRKEALQLWNELRQKGWQPCSPQW